jgi:hypothetical protein
LYWITTELNKRNVQFQSNKTRLHELFPKSLELLWVFANCILKNADLEQMKDDKSKLIDINFNNPGNSIFANENLSLENIQNNIDFSDVISETIFSVDLKIITNNNEHKILKRMCAKLSALVIQYLPVNNDIIKGFQTIDIRNRNMRNAVTLFRDFLLKTFVNAYQREDFQSILRLYQDISQLDDKKLPVPIKEFVNSEDYFDAEGYWIDFLKVKDTKYEKLICFFINLLLIRHSNSNIERAFSAVKIIKNDKRNSLEVSTVSSISQVKSFHENDSKFEPDDDHYFCYKHFMKNF